MHDTRLDTAFDTTIAPRGAVAALTSAATVDTWSQAYEIGRTVWGGRQTWAALFARAIEYASEGFPVTPSQHFWQSLRADDLRALPGFAATFAPHGRIPAVGERFTQPALAGHPA
ncbi:gamma-glutamyltransferase [Paraburkholderia bryophila]|uniref:gamma-glutamyltransferase n=1 Tax=Paraburkholderia bryophila TaxID=420952 RepID=UPI0023490AB3|nr:gamma-glutamyltransferase [Paraburkholderia bryophila]WCM24780.1 gamma-glutamyltransferase [Paraburkholderia bryophila]